MLFSWADCAFKIAINIIKFFGKSLNNSTKLRHIALQILMRPSQWCEYFNDVGRTIAKAVDSFPEKLCSSAVKNVVITLFDVTYLVAAPPSGYSQLRFIFEVWKFVKTRQR